VSDRWTEREALAPCADAAVVACGYGGGMHRSRTEHVAAAGGFMEGAADQSLSTFRVVA
jgi:hypothetical protein